MTNEEMRAFLHGPQGQANLQRIAHVAKEAAVLAVHEPDREILWVEGPRTIHALPGSMCCRFARESHEVAFNLPDHGWQFARESAAESEHALKEAGREIGGSLPGCLLFWNDGEVGHAAIDVGGGFAAENTCSDRGTPSRPGTKLTPIKDIEAAHGGAPGRPYYGGAL